MTKLQQDEGQVGTGAKTKSSAITIAQINSDRLTLVSF